ncbi:MAG: putative porin [Limisphaerales bacterium]
MNMLRNSVVALAAILLVGNSHCEAQSSDALINKLIEKGILTSQEAKELREQADQDFKEAYSARSGMPEWVSALKFNGDLRLRYENIHVDDPTFPDRNRFRYRLRFGATASLTDNFEIGLRLISGETARGNFSTLNPISGNATLGDNASKKLIGIDLAYVQWEPIESSDWNLTLSGGKIRNPFTSSEMLFDNDYTPEGLSQQLSYQLNKEHTLQLNLGQFILDELAETSNDPYLLGAQVRWDAEWSSRWNSSLGLAAFSIQGQESLTSANVPDQNSGNTRRADGSLVREFHPVYGDVSVTHSLESFPLYNGSFPIKFLGDVIYNPGSPTENMAYSIGATFGRANKRRTWELSYRWLYQEADSWYEELVNSDLAAFYQVAPVGGRRGLGSGTNIRGHVIRGAYAPMDYLTLRITYSLMEAIIETPATSNSESGRLQVDAMWRF